jgi:hypothetical protein
MIKDLKYLISSYLPISDLLIVFPTHVVTEIVKVYQLSLPILSSAVRCGNLKLVKYLVEVKDAKITETIIQRACSKGDFDIVKYLMSKFEISPMAINEILITISGKGYLKLLKYLMKLTYQKPSTSGIINACSNGHLPVVKYLVETAKISPTLKCINSASQHGHLDVVQYLVETASLTPTRIALEYVIANQHLNILQYFVEKKVSITSDTINNCIDNGANKVLKYLIETREIKPGESAIDLARNNRDLDTLKYLIEVGGFEPTKQTLSNAIMAEHEDINIIKYLVKIIDPQVTEQLLSYIGRVQNVDMHAWYDTHIKE